MQDICIRLSEEPYTLRPRTMQRIMSLALALQLGLLLYLLFSQVFTMLLVPILLLSLFILIFYVLSLWLRSTPRYRHHLILDAEGVRYRTRFMQRESEFDWDEIDLVKTNHCKVLFVLKNGEVHEISLERLQNDKLLHQVMNQVLCKAQLNGINIH